VIATAVPIGLCLFGIMGVIYYRIKQNQLSEQKQRSKIATIDTSGGISGGSTQLTYIGVASPSSPNPTMDPSSPSQ
jgi:hypothetical protein